jgi:phosphatidylinositol alpha-1,6-mannosyltransferase
MNRVAFLALLTDGFGVGGGIAQYNRDLMTALSQSSLVESVIVLPRFGKAPASSSDKLTQLTPSRRRVSWSARAAALVLRHRFDVIFCGHLNAAPLAAALARLTSKRLWLQVHGIEAWATPNAAIRHATERADLITAVSRYTRRRLLDWAHVEPWRVRVLPNTVAADYAPRARRPDLVQRHGLVGRKVIVTVGRIASVERYKGYDRIIAALPDVVARCPSAVYLVVGSGDDVPRLESEARSKGVADRVIFAGQVPADELPDYFALADVFAMPSTGEGFGIVFLEAARSGLAVIGGNRDGSVDALADGQIGRLVDPDDPRQLVDALVFELNRGGSANSASVERFAFNNFSRHVDDLVRNLA